MTQDQQETLNEIFLGKEDPDMAFKKPMTNNLKEELRKTLLLGLANHTDEFLNPGFIPGMSHEDLAKVLDRIMNSRLIERVGSLINQKEKEARLDEAQRAEGCWKIKKHDVERMDSCEHDSYLPDRIKQLKEEGDS